MMSRTKQMMMAWWFWYAYLLGLLGDAGIFTWGGISPQGSWQQWISVIFGSPMAIYLLVLLMNKTDSYHPTIPRGYTFSIWNYPEKYYEMGRWAGLAYNSQGIEIAQVEGEHSTDYVIRALLKSIKNNAIANDGHPHYYIGARAAQMRHQDRIKELESQLEIDN